MSQDAAGVNRLLYDALQRDFRNAVVAYLREHFTTAYPDDWLAQLRRPFKTEEWDRIVAAAEVAADSKVVNVKHRDQFDYLSINHFFNLFDVHWGFLAPRDPSGSLTANRKRDLLGFLRDIKTVRDPLSHPSTEDIGALDAVRVLGSARRLLEILELPTAVRALELHEREAVAMVLAAKGVRGRLDAEFHDLERFPSPLTPMVARERERETVAAYLQANRLVTITGPAGVGKTRLALAVVEGLRKDGQYSAVWVPLEEAQTAADVVPLIAAALGVPREPLDAPDLPRVAADNLFMKVVLSIGDKPMLLLLDNLEHVIDVRRNLGRMLVACSRLRLLATSRRPLELSGEQVFRLPPFTLPDPDATPHPDDFSQLPAVALFIDRAHAANPDFVLDHTNAYPVVDICRRLDGLPLAIALVASRVGFRTPAEILKRLDTDPDFLSRPGEVGRQRSLSAAVQWSYDLLTDDVKMAFRQLGVFVGGSTLDAARFLVSSVFDRSVAPDEMVAELALHNLVERSRSGRLALLQTIRDFALEALTAAGERGTAELAHARYFAVLCAARAGNDEVVELLSREVGNLAVALDRMKGPLADDDTCLRIAAEIADAAAIWLDDSLDRLWEVILRCSDATPATRRLALEVAVDPIRSPVLQWQRGIAAFDAWGDDESTAFAITQIVDWWSPNLEPMDIDQLGHRLAKVVENGDPSTEQAKALANLANLALRQSNEDMRSRVPAVLWFNAAMRIYERMEAEPTPGEWCVPPWIDGPIAALLSEGDYELAREITLALPRPRYAGTYADFWSNARKSTGVGGSDEREGNPRP